MFCLFSDNDFEYLSPDIKNLKNLRIFAIRDNDLVDVPQVIFASWDNDLVDMPQVIFAIWDNDLVDMPQVIFAIWDNNLVDTVCP